MFPPQSDRRRPISIAVAAWAFLLAGAYPAAADTCSLFASLFQGCSRSNAPTIAAPADEPNPAADERARSTLANAHTKSVRRVIISKKQKALEPTQNAPQGSLALFKSDPTLRAGDVVVTKHEFLVYDAQGQFQPLGRKAVALAALEKASINRGDYSHVVSTPTIASGIPLAKKGLVATRVSAGIH
jgi:hypothetical protein